ncbi:hypothetical protein BH23BAC4_BH23BAC4_01660 [soil metagenome]
MLTPVLFNGILKLQVPMIPREHLIAFTALCGGSSADSPSRRSHGSIVVR